MPKWDECGVIVEWPRGLWGHCKAVVSRRAVRFSQFANGFACCIRVTYGWCRVRQSGFESADRSSPVLMVVPIASANGAGAYWSLRKVASLWIGLGIEFLEQYGSDLMTYSWGVPQRFLAYVEVKEMRPPITWAAACLGNKQAAPHLGGRRKCRVMRRN